MKYIFLSLTLFFALTTIHLRAQVINLVNQNIEPVHVSLSVEKLMGKSAIRLVKDPTVTEVDEPSFVRIKGIDFTNGIIEVKVLSRLLNDASDFARGFIGIAFRINDSNTKYESIYLRPTNARADDQVRRNHSIQYYSYPNYKYDRLRKESPERYESYSDLQMNTWITMRIEIRGAIAKLFINKQKQPSLVVNDFKLGADSHGAIGLWVEVGTEGYFADLKIIPQK